MSVQFVSQVSSKVNERVFFGEVGTVNTLLAYKGSLNDLVRFEGHITLEDRTVEASPEHLPESIGKVIQEANRCLQLECWNASAAMYRLALDLATKSLLPESDSPNARTRRSLGLRMEWLFANSKLPSELQVLADCIKEDGNDGVHDGILRREDAEDLHDFSYRLLDRLFSEPHRLHLASKRRNERRKSE